MSAFKPKDCSSWKSFLLNYAIGFSLLLAVVWLLEAPWKTVGSVILGLLLMISWKWVFILIAIWIIARKVLKFMDAVIKIAKDKEKS